MAWIAWAMMVSGESDRRPAATELDTDAAQWSLVAGPADGRTPQPGDTEILSDNGIIWAGNGQFRDNTAVVGNGILVFAGSTHETVGKALVRLLQGSVECRS